MYVCMCMYVCVCMYTHIQYTYMHTYYAYRRTCTIRSYIHIYIIMEFGAFAMLIKVESVNCSFPGGMVIFI